MGKNLIQQRRGKGSARFRSHSFRYQGRAEHYRGDAATVIDFVHCAGHSAPLAKVTSNGIEGLMIAAAGIRVGDVLSGFNAGSTQLLRDIPEGAAVFNLESRPGDGGKFARASGTFAKVLTKTENRVVVMLPSKRQRDFDPNCKAAMGIVAGAGRADKPFYKAGNRHFKMKQRNKYYPHVSALSMNAVAHPFGGSRSSKKGKSTIMPRNAPAGRKVGLMSPARTGRRR